MAENKPQNTKTAAGTKTDSEKLSYDLGRGMWFVRGGKILAKHKIGEVLRVKDAARSSNKENE